MLLAHSHLDRFVNEDLLAARGEAKDVVRVGRVEIYLRAGARQVEVYNFGRGLALNFPDDELEIAHASEGCEVGRG